MILKKFLSTILAVMMIVGTLTAAFAVTTYAEPETDAETGTDTETDTEKEEEEELDGNIDFTKLEYKTPEEKLKAMTLRVQNNNYELYSYARTGEIAVRDRRTGQILFSNPYDLGSTTGSTDTKEMLLSQVIIEFASSSTNQTYYSYKEAALRDQIIVKNIKNGLRVEYAIGRTETRKLVPRQITKESFENNILAKLKEGGMSAWAYNKFTAYYQIKDPAKKGVTQAELNAMYNQWPITKQYAIYVISTDTKDREYNWLEEQIKLYCPEYTFEKLDEDHDLVDYSVTDTAPPLFRLSLEYTLDESGLTARLAANGIRFNESSYKLKKLTILPYFGAGNSKSNKGYTLIPDGSGTLTRFEDVKSQLSLSAKMYGSDFAYHTDDPQHRQPMRLPVFGVVENYSETETYRVSVPLAKYYYADGNEITYYISENVEKGWINTYPEGGVFYNAEGKAAVTLKDGLWPEDIEYIDAYGNLINSRFVTESRTESEDRGYFAIMLDGDALAEISTNHGGVLHDYSSVATSFYPRPTDSYNLADATSVGANAMWTVTSKRKYTGSYIMKYTMLTDAQKAENYEKFLADPEAYEAELIAGLTPDEEGNVDTSTLFIPEVKDDDYKFYPASYMGMVNVCRDYYEATGVLTRLKAEDVKSDIPLCIETMGAIYSTEKILSIPVTVKVPLTTFDDVQSMYTQLADKGITNINFKLSGYANGGMESVVPSKVKWESKVGGADGFKELMAFAEEKDIGIYPDFEFSYVVGVSLFDGFNYKKHAVQTMDGRYPSQREYDPAYQMFYKNGYNPISPSVFEYFYDKMSPELLEYKPTGISVSTLGSDLNSDFDDEDPYNREDSKEFVVNLLEKMQKDYSSVMVSGGNSYVLPYVDYILEVPLDSSQYLKSSNAIPFMGMVIHGYVNFTGSALNMAGDIDYELLKSIENGASMYFILNYQNTSKLKEDKLFQKYYSVNFDTWLEGIAESYNKLNGALSDVQDKIIIDHEFITGIRVLTQEEIDQAEEDKLREEAEESSRLEEEAAKTENAETQDPNEDSDVADSDVPAEDPEQTTPSEDEETDDESEEDSEEFDANNFIDNGKIVKVTYEGGKVFILNYNNFKVNVDGVEIDALDFYTYTEGGEG